MSFYKLSYLVISEGLLALTILRTAGIRSLDTNLVNMVLKLMMTMMTIMMSVDNPAPGCGMSGLSANLPGREI